MYPNYIFCFSPTIEQKKNEDGSSTTTSNKTTENKIVLENDKPLEASEVVEKPPIDLFKSIFLASSSDDNDSETEAEETKNKNSSNQQANKNVQKIVHLRTVQKNVQITPMGLVLAQITTKNCWT